jgi:hypothetical protein
VIFAKLKICGENDKHFCSNPSEGPERPLAFPLNVLKINIGALEGITVNEVGYGDGEYDGFLFLPDVMLYPCVEPEGEEHGGQLG